MRLRYTRPALADLNPVLDYISAHCPQGAYRVHKRIGAVIELLLRYPSIGMGTDVPMIRRITTTPYPYLIFYEVSSDEIVIHAVRHAARSPSGR